MNDGKGIKLGFGLATLMREPSKSRRRYILEFAYDAGFRHFDVAPTYGLGVAESELGAFAAGRTDISITTKVGMVPGRVARLVARGQGPLRWALQRAPALRRIAQRGSSAATSEIEVTVDALTSSVERSLDRLRRSSLDALLLHEVPLSVIDDASWAAIRDLLTSGTVGAFGVSGAPEVLDAAEITAQNDVSVVQTSDALAPCLRIPRRGIQWVHYGVLAGGVQRYRPLLSDSAAQHLIETSLDRPFRTVDDLVGLLLMMAAQARDGAIVLVGSTDTAHISTLAAQARHPLPEAAKIEVVRTLFRPT